MTYQPADLADLAAAHEAFGLLTDAASYGEAQGGERGLDDLLGRAAGAARLAWPAESSEAHAFAVLSTYVRTSAGMWRDVKDITNPELAIA